MHFSEFLSSWVAHHGRWRLFAAAHQRQKSPVSTAEWQQMLPLGERRLSEKVCLKKGHGYKRDIQCASAYFRGEKKEISAFYYLLTQWCYCIFYWNVALIRKKIGSWSRKGLERGVSRLVGKKLGVTLFLSLWDIIVTIWIFNCCKLTWLYLKWQNHLLYPHLCVTFNSLNISCSFFIAFSENYCKQGSAHILQCFSTPFISGQSRFTLKFVIHYWY